MIGFYHDQGNWYWAACWCGAAARGFDSLREAVYNYEKHQQEHW